jgi:hypothetical protein
MGHAVQALIIPAALSSMALTELRHTRSVPLRQGFRIVPNTNGAFDALRERFPSLSDPAVPEFWKLSGPLMHVVELLSAHGVIAYIETEYFGGSGHQAAAVWESGRLRMPPTRANIGPINSALRLMGVTVGDAHDEFQAIGLDAERSNDSWLERTP